MQGRAFLDLAREVVQGATEAHWRGAVIHAYYALLLECRDALARWGRGIPQREIHRQVRLTLAFASDPDAKQIADDLEVLSKARAPANYDLTPRHAFTSDALARTLIQRAGKALALLDAIEADPARLAHAVASLPPPIP